MTAGSAELWRSARKVLEEAFGLPEPERRAHAERRCAGDRALLDEVLDLLARDAQSESALEPPERRELGLDPAPERVRQVGVYALERSLGSGGMGTVWLARRADRQFERRVAVKLIRPGLDTDEILRRFERERQVLATFEHPGIARLYDGGATADGVPYIVMEYVEGLPIDRFCAERALGVRARIQLFLRVCAAVGHAHSLGVVHRDLKPLNLLVTAAGEPKLLDFGIAKLLDEAGGGDGATRTATPMMTPEYASPEQIRGEPVGVASDVYGLGVVLYELVAGRRPSEPATGRRADLERAICEEDPPPPSAVAARTAAAGGAPSADARRLRAELAGDLDTIVLKALAKEPARRYASVEALAGDLERHLAGLPVSARPTTWVYRARKFVRRNRGLTATTLIVFAILCSALAVSLALYADAEEARAAEVERGAEARRERAAADRRAYVAAIAAAESALRARDVPDARQRLLDVPSEARAWEWRHLWARTDRSSATWTTDYIKRAVAFAPDGRLLAWGGTERAVTVRDLARDAVVAVWSGLPRQVESLAFDRAGKRLAAVSLAERIHVFDIERGTELEPSIGAGTSPRALAFDPAGTRILSAHTDGSVRLFDVESGAEIASWAAHAGPAASVAWSDDGASFVSGGVDGFVRAWDPASREPRLEIETGAGPVTFVDVSPDARTIASGGGRGARLWSSADGAPIREFMGHFERVQAGAFSPDGAFLATASWDQSVMVWDARTGEPASTLLGHRREVVALAWSPAGDRIATGGNEGDVRLWDPRADQVPTLRDRASWVHHMAVAPDGRTIAAPGGPCAGGDHTVVVSDVATGAERARLVGHGSAVTQVAFTPDGGRVVTTSTDRTLRVWDAASGAALRTIAGPEEEIWALALASDGRTAVTGEQLGVLREWDLESGALLATWRTDPLRVWAVAIRPDGARIASASASGKAALWRGDTHALVAELPHASMVWSIAFDAHGEVLATGTDDGTIALWDASDGSRLARLVGHTARVQGLAFNGDGARLASCGADQTVRLWDPARADELATLHAHDYHVYSVRFLPGGERLLSSGADCTVRLWDAPPSVRAPAGR